MKKIYKHILLFSFGIVSYNNSFAQCGVTATLGSSSNLFTHIRNSTNPVAADKNLNSIVFVHRNNATAFGGSSGNYRYDVSFNAGTTWSTNLGVLNPLTTNLGRYPNVCIYNPTNNVTPSNAYLGYLGATINATTSAWNGVVSGVRQLSGTGNTENYNQMIVAPSLIAHSVVKGAPGIFWAVDALYNGAAITGFAIYKGTWNSGTSDIVWATNYTVAPSFNTAYSSSAYVGDYNIAFDPTGTNGWMSFLGHVTPGPTNYAYYPVFYKTTNGGQSWTGPIQVDLNTLGCLTSAMTASTYVPTTNFEHDLAVDVNGNPHLFTTICHGTNAYSVVYSLWHHNYDITLKNGLWIAYDVSNQMSGRGIFGTSPNQITQDMAPQVSRSLDGTKIFFNWTDNSAYTLGQANQAPNQYGRGYNVTNNTWTPIKDFSSCSFSTAGQMIVPHSAAEVLEPTSGLYKIAPVYGVFTANSDPALVCNFNFLDNVTFSISEFSVAAPASPTISIAQGTNVLLCPGSTISINVPSSVGQAIWSNGATTTIIPISSSTVTTYSVLAQSNCGIGSASITITNMSINVSAPSSSVCTGLSSSISVSGNAISYQWNPGAINGTTASVNPTITTIYTVTANSNANCSMTSTVSVGIFDLPNITINGASTICVGGVVSLTASGASTYLWSGGPNTAVYTFTPNNTNVYTVVGTDSNTCINTQTYNVGVFPVPIVTAISDKTVICKGGVVTLQVIGANTYSWNFGSTQNNVNQSPTVTTIYTVTGFDLNLCSDSKTLSVLVNPTPTLAFTSSRPNICVGEKAIITVTGAATYFWSNTSSSTTVQIAPSNTNSISYTVTGTSSVSCVGQGIFTQTVSACVGFEKINPKKNLIEIFPNPNNGDFEITSPIEISLSVYNEVGQFVQRLKLNDSNTYRVSIQNLSTGIYFVVSENNTLDFKQKIIVIK